MCTALTDVIEMWFSQKGHKVLCFIGLLNLCNTYSIGGCSRSIAKSKEFNRSLCLVGFKSHMKIEIDGINVTHLGDFMVDNYFGCDVVVDFRYETTSSLHDCPGTCCPIPAINMTHDDFSGILHNRSNKFISCSVASTEYFREKKSDNHTDERRASMIFEVIYYRRLMECKERHKWPNFLPEIYKQYRQIISGGVFIWIGTNADMETLYLQRSVLFHKEDESWGISRPIPWLATEDIYPCETNSLLCTEGVYIVHYSNGTGYNPHMPETGMYVCVSERCPWPLFLPPSVAHV